MPINDDERLSLLVLLFIDLAALTVVTVALVG